MYKRLNRYTVDSVITEASIDAAEYWFLVRAPSNRVFDAAAILERLGLLVWAPCETNWKKVARSRLKVRRRPVQYPAFFNYLFVGLIGGEPHWQALFNSGYVRAIVVTETPRGPEPYCVSKSVVATAARKQADGSLNGYRLATAVRHDLKKGCDARISSEQHSWWGHQVRIQSIEDGCARVIGQLLGKKVEFEIALDDVEKAR